MFSQQAAGESPTASAADVARRAALKGGDPDAVLATELRLVAALMSCQYGPAVVDEINEVVNVMVSQCGKKQTRNSSQNQVISW